MKLRTRYRLGLAALSAVAVVATAVALAMSASGGTSNFAANVRALATGQPPTSVPTAVTNWIDHFARLSGDDAGPMTASLRLLRSGVGPVHYNVYAFADEQGFPCVAVPNLAFGCPSADPTTSGFFWEILGGVGDQPSALLGIATDSVSAVTLTTDGTVQAVPIVNNVAFASYPNGAQYAIVSVTYADGSTTSEALNLKG